MKSMNIKYQQVSKEYFFC